MLMTRYVEVSDFLYICGRRSAAAVKPVRPFIMLIAKLNETDRQNKLTTCSQHMLACKQHVRACRDGLKVANLVILTT